MQRITVNLDPPYVMLERDKRFSMRNCSAAKLHAILNYLGCHNWPLRDCVIHADLTANSRDRVDEILNTADESLAA